MFAGLIGLTLSVCSFAEPYPNKPIKILVPFHARRREVDFTTRLIAPKLSENLRQQIIYLKTSRVPLELSRLRKLQGQRRMVPLIVGNIGPLVLAPNVIRPRPYDPIKDFTPIGKIVSTYLVAAIPADREFPPGVCCLGQAKRWKVSFASGGGGSITLDR